MLYVSYPMQLTWFVQAHSVSDETSPEAAFMDESGVPRLSDIP